jgi:hypothetical protein
MEFRDPNDQARYEAIAQLKRAAYGAGKRKLAPKELDGLLPKPEPKRLRRCQFVRRFGREKTPASENLGAVADHGEDTK